MWRFAIALALVNACAASGGVPEPSPAPTPADLAIPAREPASDGPVSHHGEDAPGGAKAKGGESMPAGSADPSPPVAPALPPPLPAGTTVLHVGDSMADALGKSLHKELKA